MCEENYYYMLRRNFKCKVWTVFNYKFQLRKVCKVKNDFSRDIEFSCYKCDYVGIKWLEFIINVSKNEIYVNHKNFIYVLIDFGENNKLKRVLLVFFFEFMTSKLFFKCIFPVNGY